MAGTTPHVTTEEPELRPDSATLHDRRWQAPRDPAMIVVRRSKRAFLGTKDERGTGPTSDTDFGFGRVPAPNPGIFVPWRWQTPALPAQIDSGAGDPGIRYASNAPGRSTAGRAIISGPPDVGSYAGVHRARMDATR